MNLIDIIEAEQEKIDTRYLAVSHTVNGSFERIRDAAEDLTADRDELLMELNELFCEVRYLMKDKEWFHYDELIAKHEGKL